MHQSRHRDADQQELCQGAGGAHQHGAVVAARNAE